MNHNNTPVHVAIIPDGNRRWARARGLNPWKGHAVGADNMEVLTRKAFESGVKHLSFWGSSLENLRKRPLREKKELLDIYETYFKRLMVSDDIVKNDTRINVIGKWRQQLPRKLINLFDKGIKETKHRIGSFLNFFLAYNGDDEMLEAVKKIARNHKPGQKITGQTIKDNLMTRELPPVDFLIRTGGEPHLSVGFMMWDIANAQFYFSEKHFPDFGEKELDEAIKDYQKRGQRGGK